MKQNLDKLDRIFRFVLALWWLGPLAPNFSAVWMNWIIAIVGWIALVESFIGWCWLHKLFNLKHQV